MDAQSDMAKEVLRSFENLFAENRREVLVDRMIPLHSGYIECGVGQLPMCTPFLSSGK